MLRVVVELPGHVVEVVNVNGTERTGCPVLLIERLSGPPLTIDDVHQVIDAFEEKVDDICEGE